MIKKYKVLSIFFPIILGTLVGFLTVETTGVYKQLIKPPLVPSAIAFPIVWSILYLFMGISYTILPYHNDKVNKLYVAQLIINLIWPLFFFRFNLYCFSIIILLLLVYFVIKLFLEYKKIYYVSAYLQIPYLLWLLFALYLNISICILN